MCRRGPRWLTPRSRASGCAVWRVRAASDSGEGAFVPSPESCASRHGGLPRRPASPAPPCRFPERPADVPERASSWNQPSRINHLGGDPGRAEDLEAVLGGYGHHPLGCRWLDRRRRERAGLRRARQARARSSRSRRLGDEEEASLGRGDGERVRNAGAGRRRTIPQLPRISWPPTQKVSSPSVT